MSEQNDGGVQKTDEEILEVVLSQARSCYPENLGGVELQQLEAIKRDFYEDPHLYRSRFG